MSHTLYQPLEPLWSALHLAWDTTRAGMTPTPADMGGKTGHVLTQGTGFVCGDPRCHGETTLLPPPPPHQTLMASVTALRSTKPKDTWVLMDYMDQW